MWSSLSGRGESLRLLDSPLDWRGRAVRASPASSPLLPRPGTPQGLGEPLWGEWMSRGIENTDLRGRSWELHQVPTTPTPLASTGPHRWWRQRASDPPRLRPCGSNKCGVQSAGKRPTCIPWRLGSCYLHPASEERQARSRGHTVAEMGQDTRQRGSETSQKTVPFPPKRKDAPAPTPLC